MTTTTTTTVTHSWRVHLSHVSQDLPVRNMSQVARAINEFSLLVLYLSSRQNLTITPAELSVLLRHPRGTAEARATGESARTRILLRAAWRWRLKWKDAGSEHGTRSHARGGGKRGMEEMGGKMRTWPRSKRESIGASSAQVAYIHLRFSPSYLSPRSLSFSPSWCLPAVAPFPPPRWRRRIPLRIYVTNLRARYYTEERR